MVVGSIVLEVGMGNSGGSLVAVGRVDVGREVVFRKVVVVDVVVVGHSVDRMVDVEEVVVIVVVGTVGVGEEVGFVVVVAVEVEVAVVPVVVSILVLSSTFDCDWSSRLGFEHPEVTKCCIVVKFWWVLKSVVLLSSFGFWVVRPRRNARRQIRIRFRRFLGSTVRLGHR